MSSPEYQFNNESSIPTRLSYWVPSKVIINGVETYIYGSNTLENILVNPGEVVSIPRAQTSEYYVEYTDYLRIGKFDINSGYTLYNNDAYMVTRQGNVFKITE